MTTIAAEPAELDRLRTVVANLANALGVIKYRSVSLADTQVIALEALAGAAQPAAEPDAQDAKRYRWLRDAPGLTLKTDGGLWLRGDGTSFRNTHYLAAYGTQYAAAESLDAAIDAAMEKP